MRRLRRRLSETKRAAQEVVGGSNKHCHRVNIRCGLGFGIRFDTQLNSFKIQLLAKGQKARIC